MELLEKHIEFKRKDEIQNIVFLGDWHLGHGACNKSKLARVIQQIIEMPNAHVFLMGDLMECITPKDKRFDGYSLDDTLRQYIGRVISEEYEMMLRMIRPLKGRVVTVHAGNHEDKIRRDHYRDIALDLSRELDAMYGDIAAITRLNFKYQKGNHNQIIDVLSFHGHGGGRTRGPKLNNLQGAWANFPDVQIVAMGHTHDLMVVPGTPKLTLPRKGRLVLVEKESWLINTGSFLKTHEQGVRNYTEKLMYNPTPLGAAGVRLHPHTGRMRGFYI